MKRSNTADLEQIQSGLLALHRASFQHRAWEDIQQRAGVNLDKASFALLNVLANNTSASCRLHEIAMALSIEAPSVTRKAQELEEDGLLKRSPDPADKRAAIVRITAKGKHRLAKLERARQDKLALALSKWPARDRRTFAKLLSRFADDLTDISLSPTKYTKDQHA